MRPVIPKSPASFAEESGANCSTPSYQDDAGCNTIAARLQCVELLDCAHWQVYLLVQALVMSKLARARFRAIGASPSILGDDPEAQIIVAHALSEKGGIPPRVAAALNYRRGRCRTWGETIATATPLTTEDYLSDVDRCCWALVRKWLPETLRWCVDRLEAGDISCLKVLFELADLARAVEARRVA